MESKPKGIVILQKGSQEAKDYMARLRAMRKTSNKTKQSSEENAKATNKEKV